MQDTKSIQGDCSTGWSHARSGSSKVWPMYPEGNSTYWYYAINRDEDDTTGIRFEGEFGHARFQSFTLYDDATIEIKKALRDTEIDADDKNQNPYQTGVDRNTIDRRYTVTVVPEGSALEGLSNVMTFPKCVKKISIWLRMYLPDEQVAGGEDGLSGGVPLPNIYAFNAATEARETVPCPPTGRINISLPDNLPPANTDGKALFYRVSFGNLYPNQHNAYLATLFESVNEKVAVVRFKPPTFNNTFSDEADEHDEILADKEVRYWSLNVGGAKVANTTACLADYEARVAEDGYVYTVFGRQLPAVKEKADALGYNFLGWGGHTDAVVIYRNLVTAADFMGGADKVRPYEETQQSADQSLGEAYAEYAPIGLLYNSVEEFLANYDGKRFDARALSLSSLQRS